MVGNAQLVAKPRAPRRVIFEETQVEPERNHSDLSTAPDAKLLANLDALLFADNDQTICNHAREQSFNHQKQSRSVATVVTVKNVPVIRVHKLAFAWLAYQRARRQPSIQKTSSTSDCACLGGVSVNDVRALLQKESKQFPDGDSVLQRYFAAHLREVERRHALVVREITHIFFTFRDGARHEQGVEARVLQA